jgi:maltoporin
MQSYRRQSIDAFVLLAGTYFGNAGLWGVGSLENWYVGVGSLELQAVQEVLSDKMERLQAAHKREQTASADFHQAFALVLAS